jgi:hypothetical protein
MPPLGRIANLFLLQRVGREQVDRRPGCRAAAPSAWHPSPAGYFALHFATVFSMPVISSLQCTGMAGASVSSCRRKTELMALNRLRAGLA